IVDKIQGRSSGTVDLTIPTTSNVDALTAYWQGRSVFDRAVSGADYQEAAAAFRRAIDLDPKFALGYAGLADTLWQAYQVTRESAFADQALGAGLTALRLNADQPAVRGTGALLYEGRGKHDEALDQLKRALATQPSNDDAHRIYARVLNGLGRPEEAISELQQAIAFKPHRRVNYSELAALYYQQRRLEDAAATY